MNISSKLSALLITIALLLIINGSYIQAKAWLSQKLIANSFNKQMENSFITKPWPWADTHAIAKVERNNTVSYVLAGANMRNLAFGPAHMAVTPLPGEHGNSVIVGHRDTHFSFLENVLVGEKLYITTAKGRTEYRVEETMIINESDLAVVQSLPYTALTLITCYPFNSIEPNPTKRYVVRAVKAA